MDCHTFIIYFWGLSWLKFPLESIWKGTFAFELFVRTVIVVSHWNVASEAFRQEQFSIWIALRFSCQLWSWTPVIPACSRSPAKCRSLPPSLFIRSWVWRRERLQFCLGRDWTAGRELARRILGAGILSPFFQTGWTNTALLILGSTSILQGTYTNFILVATSMSSSHSCLS